MLSQISSILKILQQLNPFQELGKRVQQRVHIVKGPSKLPISIEGMVARSFRDYEGRRIPYDFSDDSALRSTSKSLMFTEYIAG